MTLSLDDFNALRTSFETARQQHPEALWRRAYKLARWHGRFDVVGRGLARCIEPALAHLVAPFATEMATSLRVEVWDESETGIPAPVRLQGADFTADGRLVAAGSDVWVGAYDRAACHLVVAVANHARLQHHDRAYPFSRLLLIWYGDRGCQILHAGMVATAGGDGIVIAGGSRAGKSTTVLACAKAGLAALGDDCIVLMREENGQFGGCSAFGTLLVGAPDLCGGTEASTHSGDPRGRQLIYLGQANAAAATVRTIVLPCITPGRHSRLEPMGRGAALRAMLSTALAMDPQGLATRRGFDTLSALLDRVPCYRLIAGTDLDAIPAVVLSALSHGRLG